MKKLLPIVLLSVPLLCFGQAKDTLAPTLVSTAGGSHVAGGVNLSFAVGEPVTTTVQDPSSTFFLTQGFEQPRMSAALNFYLTFNNESCINGKDGSAFVTLTGGFPPYTFNWSSNASNNSNTIDSLQPGTYSVTVKDANGLTFSSPFTILPST